MRVYYEMAFVFIGIEMDAEVRWCGVFVVALIEKLLY